MARKMFWKLLVLLFIALTPSEVHSKKKTSTNNLKLIWSNCGTEGDPVKINSLEITPEPLNIPGVLSLTVDADLKRNLTSPIKASIIVKRKSFLGWIEVPCLDDVGSCNYENICNLTPFKEPCPPIFSKFNVPCTCPITQGHYAVKNYTFPVKAIGPRWLEHGTYKARATLSQDVHLLACYEFSFKLK